MVLIRSQSKPFLIKNLLIIYMIRSTLKTMKQKGFLSIILVLILVVVVMGGIYFFSITTNQKLPVEKTYQDLVARLHPTPTTIPNKKWYLIGQDEKEIHSFASEFSAIPLLAHYQDWLFIGKTNDKEFITTVERYNLKNKTKETIFVKDISASHSGVIDYLQIIGNDLFFATGGYLAGSELYYLDLSSAINKPVLIAKGGGSLHLEQIRGRFWIVGGVGDSCWNLKNLISFNLQTKKTAPFKEFSNECGKGTQYLGIDNKNRVLFITFEAFPENNSSGILTANGKTHLTKIQAIHIDNPNQIDTLTSDQNILKDFYNNIKYSEERDQILLYGPKIYLFDIKKNNLEVIGERPKGFPIDAGAQWKGDTVCLLPYNENRYQLEVNLQTKAVSLNTPECKQIISNLPNPTSIKQTEEQKFKDFIQQLNLPSQYHFVLK